MKPFCHFSYYTKVCWRICFISFRICATSSCKNVKCAIRCLVKAEKARNPRQLSYSWRYLVIYMLLSGGWYIYHTYNINCIGAISACGMNLYRIESYRKDCASNKNINTRSRRVDVRLQQREQKKKKMRNKNPFHRAPHHPTFCVMLSFPSWLELNDGRKKGNLAHSVFDFIATTRGPSPGM